MLQEILKEIRTSNSAINMNEMSRKLGVERSALEGMISQLVRMGRLKDQRQALEENMAACATPSCAGSCPGSKTCPFTTKMPRTFSLIEIDQKKPDEN